MKLTVLVVLLITLLAMPAFAQYVPADGTIVTIDVPAGWYTIYASGIFNFGPSGFAADSDWMSSDGFNTWRESWSEDPDEHTVELSVNEQFFSWEGLLQNGNWINHQFSPTHQYRITMYTEADLSIRIYDNPPWGYSDNSGGLNIDVVNPAVPEPSSLLALGAGIATLTTLKRRKRG